MSNPKINNYTWQRVKILDKKILADEVVELTFEKPQDWNHAPGQFVGVKIDDKKAPPGYRAYSLLEDESGHLQICVKKISGGRGSAFLHEQEINNTIDILYPLGYFGLPSKISSNLFFISTGTGIVPNLAILEALKIQSENFSNQGDEELKTENLNFKSLNIKNFFGVRAEKDLFYFERLKKLEQNWENFQNIITLSQPTENWTGNRGRVTVFLEKEIFPMNSQFFICGSGAMIKNVQEILKHKGIPSKNIFFEDFNE